MSMGGGGTGNAYVTWATTNPGTYPIGSYVLSRSTNNVTFTTLATLANTARKYHDSTVTQGTTYWYQVQAFDTANNAGVASAPYEVTIP